MFRFQFNPLSIDFGGLLEIHVIEQSSRNKNIDLTTETDHDDGHLQTNIFAVNGPWLGNILSFGDLIQINGNVFKSFEKFSLKLLF